MGVEIRLKRRAARRFYGDRLCGTMEGRDVRTRMNVIIASEAGIVFKNRSQIWVSVGTGLLASLFNISNGLSVKSPLLGQHLMAETVETLLGVTTNSQEHIPSV